jgi:hypothetical protein
MEQVLHFNQFEKQDEHFVVEIILWIPTLWSKLIFTQSLIFKVPKQLLDDSSLEKANIKLSKIVCWLSWYSVKHHRD